jgi:hypothetical protein
VMVSALDDRKTHQSDQHHIVLVCQNEYSSPGTRGPGQSIGLFDFGCWGAPIFTNISINKEAIKGPGCLIF